MKSSRMRSVFAMVLVTGLVTVGALPAHAKGLSKDVNPTVSYIREVDAMPRAWFGSTMVLYTTYETSTHYYDGNNVGIEMTCSSNASGTFNVTLMRIEGNSSASLGTAKFKRNGFTKATWEGVGPGAYYFVMSKPTDGRRVTSSDVAMYSW